MRDAYSLGHNFGEIWEILLSEDNINVGQKINNIDLPATCKICAINRKDTIIFPDENTILEENDILVVYVGTKSIKKAENIFA
jgi:Trk K+ transport system NAD-binding subunit